MEKGGTKERRKDGKKEIGKERKEVEQEVMGREEKVQNMNSSGHITLRLARGARLMLMAVIALWGSAAVVAQQSKTEADRIVGTWLTADGKAYIDVYRCGEKYCGKISWLKEPEENGKPKVDSKNPDENLRTQPVLGLRLMRDFSYDEHNRWGDGKVYDPESGSDYSAKLRLEDDTTMVLRGYVLMPLFGRSETWTRVREGSQSR